jgi:hypothetical protein
MTIEIINYYSIRVRQKLEKELDIDLVDGLDVRLYKTRR